MIDPTTHGSDRRTFLATARRRPLITLRRLFPSLAAAAAVLMFLGITAPAAYAQQQLITYFNFNDRNETSDPPGIQTTWITQTPSLSPGWVDGTTLNAVGSDPAGLALQLSFNNTGGGGPKSFEISTVSTVGLTNLSLSYATLTSVAVNQMLSYSTDGGTTFTKAGSVPITPPLTPSTFTLVTFNNLAGAENQASVIFKITLSAAGSNQQEFNDFDNIQLTCNAVPEPATVVGGLLGALGLCWHQRRRLSEVRHLFRFSRQPAAV